MYGITEQIRVMNEINACLVQHLTTNNLPPAAAPVQEKAIDLANQATTILKVSKALVGHIQPETGDTNHQVRTPGEKGVILC